MATYSMTQEQLQSILDQHVEKLLGAGLIKKGKSVGKSISKKSAAKDASDAASDGESAKRAPNPWILFTKRVRDLSVLATHKWEKPTDCQMFCSSLKEKNPDYSSWTDESITSALSGWTRPEVSKAFQGLAGTSKAGKKAAEERRSSEASDTSSAASAASASASAPAEKKKPGRPKKSDEEKEAAKAAKKAEKETAAASKKAEKVEKKAEKVEKKTEKKVEAKKAAAAPKKAPEPVEEDSEEEDEVEMCSFEFDGQQLFWNESTGEAFENIEGALGDLVGTFDGITLTPA